MINLIIPLEFNLNIRYCFTKTVSGPMYFHFISIYFHLQFHGGCLLGFWIESKFQINVEFLVIKWIFL